MAGPRFTAERRGRFVGLIEAGSTQEEACAAVGVTRATIVRWVAQGRKGKSTEHAEFAKAMDAARGDRPGPVSGEELIQLLERQARKGSVRAIQLLLERPWEKKRDAGNEESGDPMDALEGDELAPRRRRRGAS